MFFTKRSIVFVLVFLMIFGSVSVFANDLTPEQRALEKIYELASILDGKYFTTTQKCCYNNACDSCYNLNVTSSDWFVDTFGYEVAKKQMAYQHFPNASVVPPAGWSCFGFSVFAQWYIFSPSNDGVIGDEVTCVASYATNKSVRFNYETLVSLARPGDAIRISRSGGGHSVIFVSCDKEGVTVLDNNYVDKNMVALHTIPYTSRYGYGPISNCGISITRTKNYDTVTTGTDCAAISADSGFEFEDIKAPLVHVKGRGFSLGGTIKSGKLIKAARVDIVDALTEKTVLSYTANPGRRSYSLAGSELDVNTKFGTLKNGLYYMDITVSDIVDYTKTYRSNCFSVCDEEHYCCFDEGVYDGDEITYTCQICGRFEIYEVPSSEVEIPEEDSAPPLLQSPSVETNVEFDLDNSGRTDANDAIYLLYSCFFGGESYPVEVTCDFDGNGKIDSNDAIYLLYHAFFGNTAYPVNE